LGPNCRNEIAIGFVEIGLTLKRGKGPDSPPPIPPAVPTLYAPDPVQKSESESRKREKQLREKGLLKSAAEKSLFIVAIQAIDERAERERLFP
jgi:hypothetical protein